MKVIFVLATLLAVALAQWAPNNAQQVSNANSGAGGTSIASGTANANYGGGRPWSPSPWGYPSRGYGYRPNSASQTSNANSGAGGTSIASGTANANYRERRVLDTTLSSAEDVDVE